MGMVLDLREILRAICLRLAVKQDQSYLRLFFFKNRAGSEHVSNCY